MSDTIDVNEVIRGTLARRREDGERHLMGDRAQPLKERLKRAYLGSDPSATPADFDRDWPEIERAYRREAAVRAMACGHGRG